MYIENISPRFQRLAGIPQIRTTTTFVMLHSANTRLGTPKVIHVNMIGAVLLNNSLLNKGSAFSQEERRKFKLEGSLPFQVNTLEEQILRAYSQYQQQPTPLLRNDFLQSMRDQNEVLFYALLAKYLEEMLPIIYTPTEGEYIQKYSREFRRPRGVYLSYPLAGKIESLLLEGAWQNSVDPKDIDLIVLTDGEEILGIGDQGVGGIGISIAKLVLYTATSGVHPGRVLPVVLDVGTNNEKLLDDPLYIGWREKRISTKDYDAFVDEFVQAVKKNFKNAFLHWEDFGLQNARRMLTKYQPDMCTFNDDVQGTGAITLATVMTALKLKKEKLSDQRVVIFGAGTAGIGIADQLRIAMEKETGLSTEEAVKHFWCVDKIGLITKDIPSDKLSVGQDRYVRAKNEVSSWQKADESTDNKSYTLLDVIQNVRPTILIGTSTAYGTFTERVVTTMSSHVDWPIILPLSNPTRLVEAEPKDVIHWARGKAFIATGSPFAPVKYDSSTFVIAECNNSLIYPGIGLGCIVSRARHCTEDMIWEGIQALSELSPALKSGDRTDSLLPEIKDSREVSHAVACAVVREAIKSKEARVEINEKEVEQVVREAMWESRYVPFELESDK